MEAQSIMWHVMRMYKGGSESSRLHDPYPTEAEAVAAAEHMNRSARDAAASRQPRTQRRAGRRPPETIVGRYFVVPESELGQYGLKAG